MTLLPNPPTDRAEVVSWVSTHLASVVEGPVRGSRVFRGGQQSADAALAAFDVTGYAARRNQVLPESARGASMLSPYIRHGLLSLREVWDAVADGPAKDRRKFRDELLWQSYSRHLYARLGPATGRSLRAVPPAPRGEAPPDPWTAVPDMECMDWLVESLESDGWLVNQTRMWAASHWTVRHGAAWQDGEDLMFRNLLDGSRAANRLGWQWTVGAGTGRPYGFSRWQVRKRAPELCDRCVLADRCPIAGKPTPASPDRVAAEDPRLRTDADPRATAGPAEVQQHGVPEAVWLTAESLGDGDPALTAAPSLPAVFVFDEPLLRKLRLAGPRLVFLAETLADLATRRELEVHLASPAEALEGRALAVTWAPVPGFASRAARIAPVQVHPWPWLVQPHGGSVRSFSAWRKGIATP